MITALIVDDERRARNGLQILIKQHLPEIDLIFEAQSAMQATSIVQTQAIDLVFLDIEMPSTSGIAWITEQSQRSFEVIFTTAYNEFAIQAIRLSALDYLQKPIDAEELCIAFNRFLNRRKVSDNSKALLQSLIHNLDQTRYKHPKIAIPTVGGSLYFNVEDIIHCEAHNNYTIFYLTGNHKHVASQTLKEYDDILSAYDFLRTHQSHLINPKYVKKFTKGLLELEEDHYVPVARRKHMWISEKLKKLFS
jgi:two-component system LytT family response regulator